MTICFPYFILENEDNSADWFLCVYVTKILKYNSVNNALIIVYEIMRAIFSAHLILYLVTTYH